MKGFGLGPQIPAAPVNCLVTATSEGCNFCKAATFRPREALRERARSDTGAQRGDMKEDVTVCVFTFVRFDSGAKQLIVSVRADTHCH